MGLTWLKHIAVTIEKKQSSIFTYPVEKQKSYVNHFGVPKDALERSYFQYCCQMKLYGKFLHWLLNLAALPMSVGLLLKYKRNYADMQKSKNDCVFICYDLPENIVPNSLRQRYPEMLSIKTTGNHLDREDTAFLKRIFKRYPFSWLFWLKIIIKVSQYSDTIKKYAPTAIISCDEFSFTSSAITVYCRAKGIKRINVMHGEKLYFMRDAFVCYDEYYVWNQYYADLLIQLRAEESQFKIEVPDSLKINTTGDVEKSYDFTYYLAAESKPVLEKIAASLQVLKQKGNNIAVRPHPRYSDRETVAALFADFAIEDARSVSIEESILKTGRAISLYSTVLHQAANNGVAIVIDDVSNPKNISALKQAQYVMLKTNHTLLSALVEDE